MKKCSSLFFFFLIFFLFFVFPIEATENNLELFFPKQESQPIPGSFIVEFEENPEFEPQPAFQEEKLFTTTSKKFPQLKTALQELETQALEALTSDLKIYKLTLPQTISPQKVYQELKSNPSIKAVAQNRTIPFLDYFPNDPYFQKAPGKDPKYYYQWNLAAIKMPQAWEITRGSKEVKVAVIDSGLAFEDYDDPVYGLKFKKASELEGVNILPGLRYIDTEYIYGPPPRGGLWPINPPIADAHPNDTIGHGTHVTMTIVQAMNNGKHATGIAPKVSIIPISPPIRGAPGVSSSGLLKALDFAKEQKADVINMSLGADELWRDKEMYEIFRRKYQELFEAGITLVAAAGNSGMEGANKVVTWPAAFPSCIAVGATRWDNKRAFYSSYLPATAPGRPPDQGVTLVAPGGEICPYIGTGCNTILDQNKDAIPDGILQQTIYWTGATSPQTPQTLNFTEINSSCLTPGEFFDKCGVWMGTSMASPHVTAVVALLKSVNSSLTPSQIREILTSTAQKNVIQNYNQTEYGAGLMDAYAAVLEAKKTAPCPSGDLGNLDCDSQGLINDADLAILLENWQPQGPSPVDEIDLSFLLSNWRNI